MTDITYRGLTLSITGRRVASGRCSYPLQPQETAIATMLLAGGDEGVDEGALLSLARLHNVSCGAFGDALTSLGAKLCILGFHLKTEAGRHHLRERPAARAAMRAEITGPNGTGEIEPYSLGYLFRLDGVTGYAETIEGAVADWSSRLAQSAE